MRAGCGLLGLGQRRAEMSLWLRSMIGQCTVECAGPAVGDLQGCPCCSSASAGIWTPLGVCRWVGPERAARERIRSDESALATALGIVMLVAGILAFVLASEAMLATLVAAMVALWLIATGRHALTGGHPQLRAHGRALRTAPRDREGRRLPCPGMC
jgi:hypothetical protein